MTAGPRITPRHHSSTGVPAICKDNDCPCNRRRTSGNRIIPLNTNG